MTTWLFSLFLYLGLVFLLSLSIHGIVKWQCKYGTDKWYTFLLTVLNSIFFGIPGWILAYTTEVFQGTSPRRARRVNAPAGRANGNARVNANRA